MDTMKPYWIWLSIVLLCTIVCLVSGEGRQIRCYKCISTRNATGNFGMKGEGCLDPFNNSVRNRDSMVKCAREAVGCMKMYRKIDGKEYMKRQCIYSRPKSDDYCDEWSVDNAEGIDCYCHKDGCNGSDQNVSFSICLPILLGLKLLQYFTSQVKI